MKRSASLLMVTVIAFAVVPSVSEANPITWCIQLVSGVRGKKKATAPAPRFPIQVKEEWFSSHDPSPQSVDGKPADGGKTVYGHYLTTNVGYAQTYSKDRSVANIDVGAAKLKPVSFDWGMSLDAGKVAELRREGYDGVLFDGMGGLEIAIINEPAMKLKGRSTPIPEGMKGLIEARRPISAAGVELYKITLPPGYVQEGDRFVFKGP